LKRFYKYLAITLIVSVSLYLGAIFVAFASAKAESVHKTAKSEAKIEKEAGSENHEEKGEEESVEKEHAEGEAAEEGHEGEEGEHGGEEEHEEPWFMEIPGWQSVFTVLAIIYFAAIVTFVPKVLTDKSEGEHH